MSVYVCVCVRTHMHMSRTTSLKAYVEIAQGNDCGADRGLCPSWGALSTRDIVCLLNENKQNPEGAVGSLGHRLLQSSAGSQVPK